MQTQFITGLTLVQTGFPLGVDDVSTPCSNASIPGGVA